MLLILNEMDNYMINEDFEFVAIDVETANSDKASICSIGAALFSQGSVVDEWYSLIDPCDYFDRINISIHGIKENDVRGAPNFRETANKLNSMLEGRVVVTHTHFDRLAIHQAASRWSVPLPNCSWLDSARVARRTWADCSRAGYGLAELCTRIGYEFEHHHALADAKAAGHVLLAAMTDAGLDIQGALARVRKPIHPSSSSSSAASVKRDGNPDGPLAGETVVFTGALEITRQEAADLAASVGCAVAANVSNKTTILVVGDMDVQKLAGHSKSAKHRKAEEMAKQGNPIRIVRETDFKKLVYLD